MCVFFFFKQKTAYEMRISDWSSDVCSSDLLEETRRVENSGGIQASLAGRYALALFELARDGKQLDSVAQSLASVKTALAQSEEFRALTTSPLVRSEEHTSELQSLMRISYAVFCLKTTKTTQ